MLKNTRSNLIRCTVFLLILGIVFFYLNQVFSIAESEESKKNFNQFYDEKKNSLDGIFFGASSVNRYWVAAKAYHDTGIAVYNLGTTSQPLVVVKSLLEETAKSQKPKVFIIELRWLVRNADRIEEAFIRKVTDSMHFSATKIQAVNESVDYAIQGDNDVVDNKFDYYIPILKYHGRWNEEDLTTDDLRIDKTRTLCKGFFLTPSRSFRQVPQSPAVYSDETVPLAPETQEVFDDLLDYCDSIETEVLFVLSPHSVTEENFGRLNEAVKIARERGYTVLNFNTKEMIEKVGINWETDFFNSNHVNILGAEKYTAYLANYIVEHYNVTDHRGDPDYASWDKAYENYLDFTEEKRKQMEE